MALVHRFNTLDCFSSGLEIADKQDMGSINGSNSYLQSVLSSAIQGTGLTNNANGNKLNAAGTNPLSLQSDSQQLSPFAQMMSTLQQLQQADPTKYKEVTQQIATNLQTAAQTAQSDGNTTAATQLTQLSSDFTNASQTGQLPDVKDLAQAVGGHHGHHHGHHAHASDSNSSSTQPLDQILSAFQTSASQNDSLNPTAIIMSTLSGAGLTTSGS